MKLREKVIENAVAALEGALVDPRVVFGSLEGIESGEWTPKLERLAHLTAHFVADRSIRESDLDYASAQVEELKKAINLSRAEIV